MNDSQVLAVVAAILMTQQDSLGIDAAMQSAVAIAETFGLTVSEHTQEKLGIRPYGERLPEAWRDSADFVRAVEMSL